MVKTIDILTHPTPAHLDAHFTVQGRRECEYRGVRGRILKKTIQRGHRRVETEGVVSGLR